MSGDLQTHSGRGDFLLTGADLTFRQVWGAAHRQLGTLGLASEAMAQMQKSRQYIEKCLQDGQVIYGVNTGFGAFANVRISQGEIAELQRNLIRSHCCGIGAPFTKEESRAIALLRANALAKGHSGVRPIVVEKLLELLNKDLIPVIPSQGSVGASGDLAPLAHLALALIGEGEVWHNDTPVSAAAILPQKGFVPLELQAKEGLSLINGCQVMTASGLLSAYRARRALLLMDLAGAMSLEALRGSRRAFDPLIFATRPHPGEAKTACNLLNLMGARSEIGESHENCNKVQDAYSLRCMPAVHGAAKDAFGYVLHKLETEANSSTDNPLVFPDANKVLSCGNFHGEPVAFSLDFLAIALSGLASISECRIEKLINPAMSDLPAFLAPSGGLNSGMMIVQVAAASLVSENKILSHPASVDSIPTSADKEDHVSMGTIAARKLSKIVDNLENVLAMELLCASQALDFLKPLRPAAGVAKAYDMIRENVKFAAVDRVFARDIQLIRERMLGEDFLKSVEASSLGPLQI